MFQLLELSTSVNLRLINIISPILKTHNLSSSEFLVLWKINKRVSRSSNLARTAGVLPSTMTAMLDRFDKRGYIKRVNDPTDRRSIFIEGTPDLKILLEQIVFEANAEWMQVSENIPSDFLEKFIENLQMMRNFLEPFRSDNLYGQGTK